MSAATPRGRLRGLLAVLVVSLGLASGSAQAGRSCEQRPPTAETIVRAMALAEHAADRLDQTGSKVVVIARAGQNLSEYGLRYSHLGFAYREGAGQRWRVVHKLNQCGSARASLYRQGLGEFSLDDLWQYEAAVVVLPADAQAAFKRLGARMFAANVAFDDHPNEKRFSDRIETVTVDSVFRWLDRSALGGKVQVIR